MATARKKSRTGGQKAGVKPAQKPARPKAVQKKPMPRPADAKPQPKAKTRTAGKPEVPPAAAGKATAPPPKGAVAKGALAKGAVAKGGAAAKLPAPGEGAAAKPAPRPASGKKGGRKSPLWQRKGPHGEPFVPGDLLLPTGPQGMDEILYLLRGCVAAEHSAGEAGVAEIISKRGETEADRAELGRFASGMAERFEGGAIEPLLPTRPPVRRNFPGVVERAKHRRREIGAFLRGLDLGRTETSHMDTHGEDSLQKLMEWAARLEILMEAEEADQADYAMFHRGLDQLENTTESLIVDVELTLRRLRDRVRA
jgi:hypothetical protein